MQWVQQYNGTGSNQDNARAIVVDDSENVYISGFSAGQTTEYDFATIKYNYSGDSLWVRRYNGPVDGIDGSYSISLDHLNNVFVSGKSEGRNGNDTNSDYAIIKYNSTGVLQWIQRYNGLANGHDEAYALDIDLLGDVYVTGFSQGITTLYDYATLKYSSTGIQQWVQRYNGFNGKGSDVAKSISIDGFGNVFVTGYSAGETFPNQYDYATLKYNSYGAIQWIQRYNGLANGIDWAYSLALDSIGNVYITGESFDNNTGMDIVTIKYSQTIGIHPISTEVPVEYTLQQNYPNPFNPVTNINFSIPKTGVVKLTVYDAAGRETATLFNGELSAGTYNYDFDASHLASGIYFYKLEADDFTQTKKMVLVK